MIRFAAFGLFILHLCFSSGAFAEDEKSYQFEVSYTYGNLQLLPALIANSGINFDSDQQYSDIWVHSDINISDKLSYSGSAELTDQPHALIGTKYSRPDYPLSTGRIQRSSFKYSHKDVELILGREDMHSSSLRPQIFNYPTFGDGFSWSYKVKGWSAQHVFQVFAAEKGIGHTFRRSISYHHLSKDFACFTLGVGEYFILTGENIGFDLKRLNPFLPFALNSHDSEADQYPGYVGDTDNSLIKLFMKWQNGVSHFVVSLYVDEFQIDAVDRKTNNDAMLLNISALSELSIFGSKSQVYYGFSIANPNFGQHPGPFTTTTSGIYPLFEYTPGMKNLVYLDSRTTISNNWNLNLAAYTEEWVEIMLLSPGDMNDRPKLDSLEIHSDSRFRLGVEYSMNQFPISVELSGWSGYSSGFYLKTKFEF